MLNSNSTLITRITDDGFQLLNLKCNILLNKYLENVNLVKQLNSSNLFISITSNEIQLVSNESTIAKIKYLIFPINCMICDTRFLVVFKTQIKIYSFFPIKLLFNLKCNVPVAAISNSIIAVSSTVVGQVLLIFPTLSTLLNAHSNQLAFLSLNSTSNLLATASSNGSSIKLFNTKSMQLLFTFKRGFDSAIIHSIHLSRNYMIVSSDKPTIHVFDLMDFKKESVYKIFDKAESQVGLHEDKIVLVYNDSVSIWEFKDNLKRVFYRVFGKRPGREIVDITDKIVDKVEGKIEDDWEQF